MPFVERRLIWNACETEQCRSAKHRQFLNLLHSQVYRDVIGIADARDIFR
jgi:hypothetical protein